MTDTPPPPPVPRAQGAPADAPVSPPTDPLLGAPSGVPVYPGGVGPYQPAPEPMPGRSWQGIVAFVLGLVGIAPLGLIFGILALIRIGRTRQQGKVLAILGLVLSSIWLVAGALGLLALLSSTTDSRSAAGSPAASPQPWSAIPLGTCFDVPGATGPTGVVSVVPCNGPHDEQMYARVHLTGDDPGEAESRYRAHMACEQAESTAFVDPLGAEEAALMKYYYPGPASWLRGTAQASCTLKSRAGARLTKDLMQSPSAYTSTQRQVLDLTRQAWLLNRRLRDTPAADWQQGRTLATQVAAADRAETQALAAAKNLNTPLLHQAVALLVADDKVDAVRAENLARSGSESAWVANHGDDWRTPQFDDLAALRIAVGLS